MKTTHIPPSSSNVLPSRTLKTKPLAASLGILLATLLAGGSAQAATVQWHGTGFTTNTSDFNTAGNWTASALPLPGDIAQFFPSGGSSTPNISSSISIGGLSFGINNYTLSASVGQSLTLTNIGATTATAAFNGFLTNQTDTVSANIILAPTSGTTMNFYGQAVGSNFIFSGNISETSTTRINLNQSGIFTFSGSNSFTGGVNAVNGGITVNVNNNNALGTGPLQIGNGSVGTGYTVKNTSGSQVTVANAMSIMTTNATPTINFDGGAGLTISGTTTLSATNNVTDTFAVTNTVTLGGVVKNGLGANGLTKAGTGTLILSGSNTYTGATTVSLGTLLVNNTAGSGLGSGNATVNGGTLGGSGKFTGSVTVNANGTLAPGASIESLASGAVTLNDLSTFGYEVDSSVATSVGGDLQVVSGGLSLNGTVTLTLANIDATPVSFADGTTFTLLNYNGAWNNGLFTYNSNLLSDGETFAFNGQSWEIDYNSATLGENFTGDYLPSSSFVNITVVPEPSTWALLATTGTILVTLRRRRQTALAGK